MKECGWGVNVCNDNAAFRLEYTRGSGETYEVRYLCPRHTAWALELDCRVAVIQSFPLQVMNGEE
jgi:hypothetical protein